jgi:hypothetical protein
MRKTSPVCLLAIVLCFGNAAVPQTTISRVFVTSTTTTGSMGGILNAQSICQNRAVAAGLSGTWRAWLSTPSLFAQGSVDHNATGPYRMLDGTIVAANGAELMTPSHPHAIDRDEFGAAVGSVAVWTATSAIGNYFSPGCNNWTTSMSTVSGAVGDSSHTDETASISGRIVKVNNVGIGRAHVILSGGNLAAPLEVYTARNGTFSFSNLPANTGYTLSVSQPRYIFTPSSRHIDLAASITNLGIVGTPVTASQDLRAGW